MNTLWPVSVSFTPTSTANLQVYVHPTPSSKDNIPGFLALAKPRGATTDKDILVAWIPESKLQESAADFESYVKVDIKESGTPASSSINLSETLVSPPPASSFSSYAFSIPISDIFSLQVKQPSLGWWWGSIIIHTRSKEDQLPPLYFHDAESQSTIMEQKRRNKKFDTFDSESGSSMFWGGDHFIQVLSKYANLERAESDHSFLLVNPREGDAERFGTSLTGGSSEPSKPVAGIPGRGAGGDLADRGAQVQKAFSDIRWGLLSNLAKVTQLTRKVSQGVWDSSPQPVRQLLMKPEVKKIGDDFDSARIYLAKWALSVAEESQKAKLKVLFDDELRELVSDEGFELIDAENNPQRRNEVSPAEWNAFFDYNGRLIVTVNEVKERIFHGGLAPAVRPEGWLFLLGVYPWDSTTAERKELVSKLRVDYNRLKKEWWVQEDKERDDFWRDQLSRIEKDVHRTDRNITFFAECDAKKDGDDDNYDKDEFGFSSQINSNIHLIQLRDMLITYNQHNKNLGYVQGMSDLLSPLYVVLQDDTLAFWAFSAFMERMERNYLRDQSGMRNQLLCLDHLVQFMLPSLYKHLEKTESTNLFFFFRMLLVWFKRELLWDDVLRLWEVLWTDYLSSQFVLFVCLAILDKHKDVMIEHLAGFDEILKYMNELSMTIDLDELLVRAELLFYRFRRTVELIDRKNEDRRNSPDGSEPVAITDDLRELLSRKVIVVREGERPEGVMGG